MCVCLCVVCIVHVSKSPESSLASARALLRLRCIVRFRVSKSKRPSVPRAVWSLVTRHSSLTLCEETRTMTLTLTLLLDFLQKNAGGEP